MPLAIFDLDGTLVDQARAAREWTEGFAAEWALDEADRDLVALALAARRPKDVVFAEIIERFRLPASAGDLWDDYRARMPDLVRCADADCEALRTLRSAGWTLGIATNGMADNQTAKIHRTGLSELVDGWVVSSEVGARKPDPAIFHALAERLGHPLNGWMIGDGLDADIAGGAAVGLETAWITPTPLAEAAATITAASVAEAVRMILARA